MTPKNRLNQTKIKLKFDNKKVKLADKKRPKKKEEPKGQSLVVKLAKPMIMPPKQVGLNQDISEPAPAPLHVENPEEIEMLQMIDEYNERKNLFLLIFDGSYTILRFIGLYTGFRGDSHFYQNGPNCGRNLKTSSNV